MGAEEIAAITALVSVVLSFLVSYLSLRGSAKQLDEARRQELVMALAPRRHEAFEIAWSVLFEAESRGAITVQLGNDLVSSSLWLPIDIREAVLPVAADPGAEHDYAALRKRLLASSGASQVHAAVRKIDGPKVIA